MCFLPCVLYACAFSFFGLGCLFVCVCFPRVFKCVTNCDVWFIVLFLAFVFACCSFVGVLVGL